MDRKRVISHSYNVERVETLLVQHEREIELTAARLMIILLIELNTRICGGLCKGPFMRIVYTRRDKLERIQFCCAKRAKRDRFIAFEDYTSIGFASEKGQRRLPHYSVN